MVDILPSTGNGSARNLVRQDLPGAAPSSGRYRNLAGLQHRAYFFPDIDNNDDFTLPRGVVATAWQPSRRNDVAVATITSDPAIRVNTSATDPDGWIHLLMAHTDRLSGTNDETPVAKGASGYVSLGTIFLNHRASTPNTLTANKKTGVARLRLQFFPFELQTTGDIWLSTTSRLCPGIVAVAWQGDTAADMVAVTLNENGDVVFSSDTGGEDGWLWAWRAR